MADSETLVSLKQALAFQHRYQQCVNRVREERRQNDHTMTDAHRAWIKTMISSYERMVEATQTLCEYLAYEELYANNPRAKMDASQYIAQLKEDMKLG